MSGELTRLIRTLEDFVDFNVRELTVNLTANLIEDTPRDTGWARANWIPNIGAPFQGTSGTRFQAESGRINTSHQTRGTARVSAVYSITMGNVYITNNVPYIVQLNEGSSTQAPEGYVQIAIDETIDDLEQ